MYYIVSRCFRQRMVQIKDMKVAKDTALNTTSLVINDEVWASGEELVIENIFRQIIYQFGRDFQMVDFDNIIEPYRNKTELKKENS